MMGLHSQFPSSQPGFTNFQVMEDSKNTHNCRRMFGKSRYTLGNWHGTPKRWFARWFSSSIGWLFRSQCNFFQGCSGKKNPKMWLHVMTAIGSFLLVRETFQSTLSIRLYVLRFRDYTDPFLFFFSDGIGTIIPIRSGGVWILRARWMFQLHPNCINMTYVQTGSANSLDWGWSSHL